MLLPGGFKYLLCGAVITLGLLGVSVPVWGEEKASGRSSLEEEKSGRDPFSLPGGVKFLKKEKGTDAGASSLSTEWKEGMVASRVDGIFQSGKKAMAIINHMWVEEGGLVGEEQVVEIKQDEVVLTGKNGEKRVLPFKGGKMDLKVTEWVKPKAKEKK